MVIYYLFIFCHFNLLKLLPFGGDRSICSGLVQEQMMYWSFKVSPCQVDLATC